MVEVVIVSGLSGAGKTTALKVLEDMGYFCIDNLPPVLLKDFITLVSNSTVSKVAITIDVRSAKFGENLTQLQKALEIYKDSIKLLFLEASLEELIKRFSFTRRRHPLEGQLSLREAILKEQELLSDIRQLATVIDTTNLDTNGLRKVIISILSDTKTFFVRIRSFGFKYGVPTDTDFIIDTRFLPNPFYVRELAHLDGRDEKIHNYFENYPEVKQFIQQIVPPLLLAATLYKKEGRPSMTISVGCTGGRHRSVYVAEKLAESLKKDFQVIVEHRDVDR
ncbi:RNase adapter RapZ [Pseudothermotoga thermarum]|uniref:Uncharacterized protein n=1 Tax=Pseudothermotoga thermarum DSM 5069 TaxID=688269 RepID=F7YVG8_9THEM|nr:RNase adapter RapZ [Pseudothermotoga thermarum]AEH50479.1 hypothetical protein Theth_0384 [Pseudothermotoga thermarum DSM 5069]